MCSDGKSSKAGRGAKFPYGLSSIIISLRSAIASLGETDASSCQGGHLIPKTLTRHFTLNQAVGETAFAPSSNTGQDARKPLRVDQLLSYVILACGLLTFVVGSYQILSSHSPVPMGDEWTEIDAIATAPHHQPPLTWLWAQHNEHRVVFYRLLLLADIHLFHGNHWISFWSMFAVQCALLGLLVWLLRREGFRGTLWRAITGLGAFCLFSPSQWQNFGWAFQISFLLPGFFFTLALLGLLEYQRSAGPSKRRWIYLGLSILAASAATYSNGNGVVVWPLLFSAAAVLRVRLRALLAYAVSGFALIGSYLYHYASPPYHSSPWQSIRHPLGLLDYTFTYLGVALPPWIKIRDALAVSSGAFGLLAALAAAAWVLTRPQWRKPLPVVLLGLMFYSLTTAFITALGRIGFGADQAIQSRYQTYNLLFWFSVFTLWLLIVDEMAPFLRTAMLIASPIVMLFAAGTLFPLCLRASQLKTLRSEAPALTLIIGVPDKQALEVLYPDPSIPWRDAEYLREQHLFMFSGLWYGHMGEPLDSVYHVGSEELCAGQVSVVEPVPTEDSLTGQDTGGLRVSGWAVDRPSEKPIRSLVITANGKIAGFAVGGLELQLFVDYRDKIAGKDAGSKAFLKKARFVEWSGYAHPAPGTSAMEVYAVGNRRNELCHLATVAVPKP